MKTTLTHINTYMIIRAANQVELLWKQHNHPVELYPSHERTETLVKGKINFKKIVFKLLFFFSIIISFVIIAKKIIGYNSCENKRLEDVPTKSSKIRNLFRSYVGLNFFVRFDAVVEASLFWTSLPVYPNTHHTAHPYLI